MNWSLWMVDTYWLKQTDKPLFEDVLWARPENKRYAGKLLIVGGNLHGFAAPGTAYGTALKAGIGMTRIILPDALQKTVGKMISEAEFAPSTPSGGFSKAALAVLIDNAAWADGVLLVGDFGANSETVVLLENFLDEYSGPATLSNDAVEIMTKEAKNLLKRPSTLLVSNLAQLQKIAIAYGLDSPIKSSMGLLQLVRLLYEWSSKMESCLLTEHENQIIFVAGGKVSTTTSDKTNLAELAATASVWWLQQPDKVFKTITTAIFEYSK